MRIPMRSEEVELSIWGAMGGLLDMMVAVSECSAVAGAAVVGTFVVVSHFSPNLKFSFATADTTYATTRSPPPLPILMPWPPWWHRIPTP